MSSPDMKPNRNTVAEVMQKADSNSSAGAAADSEQKVENTSVRQHSRKPLVVGSQNQRTQKGSVKIVSTLNGKVLSEKTVTEKEYNAIPKPEPICHMIANPKNPEQFLWLNPKQYVEGLGYNEHINLGLGRVTS
jgi:hypothetical protein